MNLHKNIYFLIAFIIPTLS